MKKSLVKNKIKKLNIDDLQDYLLKKNISLGKIQSSEVINEGLFSNTYVIKTSQGEFVLKRAVKYDTNEMNLNNIEREYQIMSILNAYFDQVPMPIIFCREMSVIGDIFYIMERKKGTVLNTQFIGNYSEEIGREISEEVINLLVDLHSIDYKQTALKDMTDEVDGNYLSNHVEDWIQLYYKVKTNESPDVEKLVRWLRKEMPVSKYTTIIHGEFILNNMMFDKNLSTIKGLFDFKLTKVGDPLIDLAIMLSYWVTAEDHMLYKQFYMKSPVTVLPGFYTQNEMIMRYVEKSGRDLSDLFYYRIFACLQLAAMTQQKFLLYKEVEEDEVDYKWMPIRVQNIINYALAQIKE